MGRLSRICRPSAMMRCMAKRSGTNRGKQGEIRLKRKPVVKDERLLSPVLADYATITLSQELVIHNLFQTVIPVGDIDVDKGEIDAALVARFFYTPDFFRAMTALFLRQYVAFEGLRERKEETISWIRQLLSQLESGGSTRSEQTKPH